MKYWQKVRVTSWFYEWMEWYAIREKFLWFNAMMWNWKLVEDIEITVSLITWKTEDDFEIVFPKDNLELI